MIIKSIKFLFYIIENVYANWKLLKTTKTAKKIDEVNESLIENRSQSPRGDMIDEQ